METSIKGTVVFFLLYSAVEVTIRDEPCFKFIGCLRTKFIVQNVTVV